MAATPTQRANEKLMVQLARCRARGMTAREVAAEVGLHYSVLSALAHGRRMMRPAVAERLAVVLGVEPSDLLPSEGDNTPPCSTLAARQRPL